MGAVPLAILTVLTFISPDISETGKLYGHLEHIYYSMLLILS